MANILDGKQLAAVIRSEVAASVREIVARGANPPGLTAILIGEDPASAVYVRNKARASKQAGLDGRTLELPATVPETEVLAAIERLNRDDAVDGILVQLPIPDHLKKSRVLARVAPEKDVDGFHPLNVGRLWAGESCLAPATPRGIIELLERSEIEIGGRRAVIIGRSDIVGKPLAALLLERHATVTICHSRTPDLPEICRQADILVAAVGRPGMVGPEMVKQGAVVIDVGINRVQDEATFERLFPADEGRRQRFEEKGSVLVGDVDFARVEPLVAAITPVPGGVGPLTVAMLLANTLTAAKRRRGLLDPPA